MKKGHIINSFIPMKIVADIPESVSVTILNSLGITDCETELFEKLEEQNRVAIEGLFS
ncbi:MAG: hypothetical protein QF371_07980 [Flavobacteriales bacterium]|nr:hypothetical protein [Flavobacteriales bacterium]